MTYCIEIKKIQYLKKDTEDLRENNGSEESKEIVIKNNENRRKYKNIF